MRLVKSLLDYLISICLLGSLLVAYIPNFFIHCSQLVELFVRDCCEGQDYNRVKKRTRKIHGGEAHQWLLAETGRNGVPQAVNGQ